MDDRIRLQGMSAGPGRVCRRARLIERRSLTRSGLACAVVLAALALSACEERNTFVSPPPPKVDVALPVKQTVQRYLNATGSTAAVNTTTLVARVPGFIEGIHYKDGDTVKAGTVLFVIEPKPYELAVEQAEAGQSSAQASSKQLEADYQRQVDLAAKDFASKSALDQATAARDAALAKQKQSDVDAKQAELNLSYTKVKAPFDGIVTERQVSMGQLVGSGGTTTLATIVQLDPIYVNFAVSETDVLRVRAGIKKRGLTQAELKKIPVEVGLQSETGYPHRGTLDYASPSVDASTGTLMVRGVLPNAGRQLLPGYFVRVRVPLAEEPDTLLVPDRAIGTDQGGRYVFVVGKGDVVAQRKVEIGQLVGELRVIEKGVEADDKVVIAGLLAAVPGQKVEPSLQTLSAAAPEAAP